MRFMETLDKLALTLATGVEKHQSARVSTRVKIDRISVLITICEFFLRGRKVP